MKKPIYVKVILLLLLGAAGLLWFLKTDTGTTLERHEMDGILESNAPQTSNFANRTSPELQETASTDHETVFHLTGVYVYVYAYNTEDFIENHYLEFKDKRGFYYGTSDDFDDAREGYPPGFFSLPMQEMSVKNGSLEFSLTATDSVFYTYPVTPFSAGNENESWDYGVGNKTRFYTGAISGDAIRIRTEGFDERLFVKKLD